MKEKLNNFIYTIRANQSIFFSFFLLKIYGIREIFVPDQGGWVSFKKYPSFLNLNKKILETNYGKPIIEKIENIKDSALIICSSPGYLIEITKELKEIKKVLNENNSFLIVDNSSGFIFKGDIDLMSFGYYKPINLGFGGYLRINNQELFEIWQQNKDFFESLIKIPKDFLEKFNKQLKILDKKLSIALDLNKNLKEVLSDYLSKEIEQNSLNLCLKFNNSLINKFAKNNIPFLKLPNYNRLKIKGISLEIKKMLFNEKTKDFSIKELKEHSKKVKEKIFSLF